MKKKEKKLNPVWNEILLTFLDNWGQSIIRCAIVEALDQKLIPSFYRSLELEGNDLFIFTMTQDIAADLFAWLEWQIPHIWGAGEEIGRLVLIFDCSTDITFAPIGAQFKELATRFPFPIIFRLSPHEPWQKWIEQHHFLFSDQSVIIDH